MDGTNKMSWSLRTLPALTVAAVLCGCIPIPYTHTYSLSLPTPPASLVQGSTAPHGTPTISVSGRVESELAKGVSPGDVQITPTIEGTYGGAFIVLWFENMEFKSDQDVGAWARDGLANKLEAAGYHVQRIGAETKTAGPVLVTIDIAGLSAKSTPETRPQGVHVYFGGTMPPPLKPATCSVELNATITILKQGEPLFSKSYRNSYQKEDVGCGMYNGMYLGEVITKAFESLLSEAIPEVTASLSRAS
jgi:hypothetical protein